MSAVKDITGLRCGKLEVIRRAGSDVRGEALWLCRCECGNTHVAQGSRLRTVALKSCGCEKGKSTHGRSKDRIYRVWDGMNQRCSNPNHQNYRLYGGRGIAVCDDWRDAEAFIAWAEANGYRDDLEIDRIDNDLGYCPENCRFVTPIRNKRNMRTTTMVTYRGRRMPLADLADETNIPRNSLRRRIFKMGMTAEEAVEIPRDTWRTRRLLQQR